MTTCSGKAFQEPCMSTWLPSSAISSPGVTEVCVRDANLGLHTQGRTNVLYVALFFNHDTGRCNMSSDCILMSGTIQSEPEWFTPGFYW